ncbi:MAG: hypothetical protein ACE1Z9_08585 [Acidimicrobiia bacterium]
MMDPSLLDDPALVRVLDKDGAVVGDEPDVSEDELVTMYTHMINTRVFDRRATAAQRQGRLGTFAILEGHEAIQVGSAMAMRTHGSEA